MHHNNKQYPPIASRLLVRDTLLVPQSEHRTGQSGPIFPVAPPEFAKTSLTAWGLLTRVRARATVLGLACRGDAVFPSDDVEKIIWAEAFFPFPKWSKLPLR